MKNERILAGVITFLLFLSFCATLWADNYFDSTDWSHRNRSLWAEDLKDSFGLGIRIKNMDFNLPANEMSNVKAVPEVYFRAPKGRWAFEMSFTRFSTSYQEAGQFLGWAVQYDRSTNKAVLTQEMMNYDLKETLTVTPIVGSLQYDVINGNHVRAYVGGGLGAYQLRYEQRVEQSDIPATYAAAGTEVIPAEHGEVGLAFTLWNRLSIVGNARQSFAHSSRGWTLIKNWNQSQPANASIGDLGSLSYGVGVTIQL